MTASVRAALLEAIDAVRLDDVAASIGFAESPAPALAVDIPVQHLVAVALARHGAPAALRALARREQTPTMRFEACKGTRLSASPVAEP